MTGRVLVVEDDARIRTALRLALEDEGYIALDAHRGEEALDILDREHVDLVILDLMLPGMDGFEVCRSLRRLSDVPVVIVTARDDTHDVVAGLEAGADDYVTKPFVVKELAARMRALLRRSRGSGSSKVYTFGELEIAPEAGVVRRHAEELSLTKTEFRLLCELASNAGLVLSRDQLLEHVWGYDFLGDGRLVDAHIRRLRQKIELDPSRPEWITTVRGFGYKLQA